MSITSGILESDTSNYFPTLVFIRFCIPPYSPASYKFERRLKNINYDQFNNELYTTFYMVNSSTIHKCTPKNWYVDQYLTKLLNRPAHLIRQSRQEGRLVKKFGSLRKFVIKTGSSQQFVKTTHLLLRPDIRSTLICQNAAQSKILTNILFLTTRRIPVIRWQLCLI